MILFFSGTGNSEYVAKRIGKEIGDEVINLFQKIRCRDFSEMHSNRPWVVVVPTYAWRIPRIVQEWLEKTSLIGNKNIYFALTCGGSTGNAGKYLEKLCNIKKLRYMGCKEIKMPENYIAMFSTPTEEEALTIIQQAESIIDETALIIKSNKPYPRSSTTFQDKMNSGIICRCPSEAIEYGKHSKGLTRYICPKA